MFEVFEEGEKHEDTTVDLEYKEGASTTWARDEGVHGPQSVKRRKDGRSGEVRA